MNSLVCNQDLNLLFARGKVKPMMLSARLEALYLELLPGLPVWDVGYDHGQLGLQALASGQFPNVSFVDPVDELARRLHEKLNSQNFVSIKRNANVFVCSFAELPTQVQGSVVFAGVGAETILTSIESLILQSRFYARRVILSPHRDAEVFLKKAEFWSPRFLKKYSNIGIKEVVERGRPRLIYLFEPNTQELC